MASAACGSWQAFILNAVSVSFWLFILGPTMRWSDTWQLWCNTFTTVVTYLLVFLVMNTQARDTAELRLKMDYILLALKEAPNRAIVLEDLTEDQMKRLQAEVIARAKGA